ncbi:Flp pilus assembly complex ATPase component TadA [Candidatus Woesearchaeota archaeon]|nr:Flp pilus assembly complex ATPase component TadA [Candidatus Woesearchaeota archaeon]
MFLTKIDNLFSIVEEKKHVSILSLAKALDIPVSSVTKISRYLEQLGLVDIDYKNIQGPTIKYLSSPEPEFKNVDETELINKLKFFKSFQNVKAANKLIYDLYRYLRHRDDEETKATYLNVRKYYLANFMKNMDKKITDPITKMDSYNIDVEKMVVEVEIIKQELEAVPFYIVSLLRVSDVTQQVIEKIKEEVISKITFSIVFKSHEEENVVRLEYRKKILEVMKEVFPDLPDDRLHIFADYIILTSLGMGEVEFLLKDKHLEEIVINNAFEPIWVYHKKFGWLESNIIIDDEAEVVHYATLAGRNMDKMITTLTPLLDARLKTGDRVNATLAPITTKGNTITIRKFAESPWSITDFIISGTIDYYTAALVWTAIQYELSILIVGGTGSGKTSTLNVFTIFIPPNHRVVSIEDTREIRLPRTLHWVPMETRLPNPEGKGEVSMLDLIVNSLRMRPDRIIVGEIRRKREAEVLFEAMHTGHSVYATLHANTVHEAIIRLTTEPIGIAKTLLSAVDLIFVQNRNRRTNTRRTFQVAEVLEDGGYNLLFSYNFKDDKLVKIKEPIMFYKTLELFAGLSKSEVDREINDKVKILKYLTQNNITSNEEIALLISYYYINKEYLMKKLFGDKDN